MKIEHLRIENFGPIEKADIDLKSINVIIGPQSSGKSCILKIAAYCTWVEKRIELTQTTENFDKGRRFLDTLIDFHNLRGYEKSDTYIAYESAFMSFSYNNATAAFDFAWKSHKWDYKRPRIAYIPSERNLVSVIPAWKTLNLPEDFLSFMADWDTARKVFSPDEEILDQNVRYRYDEAKHQDIVVMNNRRSLLLDATSSGLQNLIPLYVCLNYLKTGQYKGKPDNSSYGKSQENIYLRELLSKQSDNRAMSGNSSLDRRISHYLETQFSNIFLEEPETNLFPPTQRILVDNLFEMATSGKKDKLFISTHSPYVMMRFLEKDWKDFNLFLIRRSEAGLSTIKTASPNELQEIYDNNVDLFFGTE